ncbi:MAG: Clp protease N-terminal domain-containing protein [Egibacteraceae bacterium]
MIEFPAPLTPRAAHILRRAGDEARAHGAKDYIGVEHIVLAVLTEKESVPAQVLAKEGIAEQFREALEAVLNSPGYQGSPR